MRSEQLNELAAALAKAQGEMKEAELDRENPFFKSWYSTLAAIWAACREPLAKNGLSVTQGIGSEEPGRLFIESTLLHTSGQFISSRCPVIMAGKQDMQGMGSGLSYARRYALQALVGVCSREERGKASEDDDGNHVSPQSPQESNSAKPPRIAQKPTLPKAPPEGTPAWEIVSEPQRKRLRGFQSHVGMPEDVFKEIGASLGIESSTKIPKWKYETFCKLVEGWLA